MSTSRKTAPKPRSTRAKMVVASKSQQITDAHISVISEPELWKPLQKAAEDAAAFWRDFLDLRNDANEKLDVDQIGRFLKLVRAVSWVESRHGNGAGNQPARDPMQCGNPADAWWRQLAGLTGNGDRYIGGPDAKNYWAKDLPAAAAAEANFAAAAKLSMLTNTNLGHKDPAFSPTMSIYWAVPHLIWKTNVPSNRKAYQCDTFSREELLDGATAYNGGGDPGYQSKIDAAFTAMGWPATLELRDSGATFNEVLLEQSSSLVENALRSIELCTQQDKLFPHGITKISLALTLGKDGGFSLNVEGPQQATPVVAIDGQYDVIKRFAAAPCVPANAIAKKILKSCEDVYEANKDDCNHFVKAASEPYFGRIFDGLVADEIIGRLVDSNSGWTKTMSIAECIKQAQSGAFVIAGMTSNELGDSNGHLAVVVACPAQASGKTKVPIGYAGSIAGRSIKGDRLSGTFEAQMVRDEKVPYFWKMPTV